MKRRITLFFAGLAVALGCLAPAAPAFAAFNPFQDVCSKPGANKSAACSQDGSDPISGQNGILYKVSVMVAWIAGAVAIIFIIVGGLMYAASAGDSGKISTAKRTIVYAAVGLVVIAVAQTLILFVVGRL